jgi:penicillin-binding protein 1C
MSKRKKIQPLSLTKVFIYIGKPIFFLFTFFIIFIVTFLHLVKHFVQKVLKVKIAFPKFPKINYPKIKSIALNRPYLPHFPINSMPYIVAALLVFCISYALYYFILAGLPSISLLKEQAPALSTKIYDRNGELLYQIYKDENRTLIKLSDLPSHLIQATLAAEDKNFYHHFGVDPLGIMRAFSNNIVNCKIRHSSCSPQGGSTLTQQLIKNTLLSSEKTITRKLKEVVLALLAEYQYSKDEILEMYFNQVPYGGTAYGIEEASKHFLGKSAKDLTLAESAFLAGLPVSPTTLSPFGTNPYLAKIRQQQVLENMVTLGMITENDKLEAISSPIHLSSKDVSIRAPHFVMYIRDLLVKELGETALSRGGLSIKTTLDLNIQNELQNQINLELNNLTKLNVSNGAGLVLSPQTGEILAMVGSRDFFDTEHDGQVNIVLSQRQPGSSIKPLTYTLAFMRGLPPSSTIDDSPICFKQAGSSDYCPKNYDGKFHGKVSLKTALASSYNIPAIKLLNSIGVNNLVQLGKSLGITTWNDPSRFGLSLTLGGGEITMLDLAQVYSVFATGGNKIPLNPILSVTDSSGVSVSSYTNSSQSNTQVIPSSVAFQINQVLSDPQARAPAFGYNSILNIKNHVVAVKTGTTNNLRDNWTFGYTPEILVATWVGNNDNTSMSAVASGITGASPIWSRTMTYLLKDAPSTSFTPPTTIVRAKSSCTNNAFDYFIKGQEPKLNCDVVENGQIL